MKVLETLPVLTYVLVAVILASVVVILFQGNQTNRIIEENKVLNTEQTQVLTEQNDKIATLQRQSNELQKLSICLSQFILGGNFTDREECQKRIAQGIGATETARQTQTGQTGSQPRNPGQTAPAPTNPPPPVQPPPPNPGLIFDDPLVCVLGVCL